MKKTALFATVLCLMIGTTMAQSPVKNVPAQKTAVKAEKKTTKTAEMADNKTVAAQKKADKACCEQKNAEHKGCTNAGAEHKDCAKQCGHHANAQKAAATPNQKADCKRDCKANNCAKTAKTVEKDNTKAAATK